MKSRKLLIIIFNIFLIFTVLLGCGNKKNTHIKTYTESFYLPTPTASAQIENLEKLELYPKATYVWNRLIKEGFSEYAAAGILGNMMAECGGQTLDLQYDIYDYSYNYYGLCQWSLYYYPEINNKNIQEQMDFLFNTIENEFDVFGKLSGYTYEEFKNIEDEKQAAKAFAEIYERCDSASYSIREKNATIAYNFYSSER